MSKIIKKTRRFTAGLLCLGLMGAFVQANAQNYQMVNSSVTTTFIGDNNQVIESIRIDSSDVDVDDSVFYPFYNIQRVDDDCYMPFSHSWIGKSIIVQADGYNCFINRDNDTVKVNTLAQLNENWVTYQTPDMLVMAEVIAHDVVSFLGQTDSAKTISFTVYDPNMDSVIPHPVNDMTIIISKNYGMIQTLNFGLFPNGTLKYQELQTYNVMGLSSPEIGTVNLTWREIYDFEVGDEFHIINDNGSHYTITTQKIKYIYLEKTIQPYSVVYTVDREIEETTGLPTPGGEREYKHIHDTIRMTYYYDSYLDKLLSGEIIDEEEHLKEVRMEMGDIPKKGISYFGFCKQEWSADSCWSSCLTPCLSNYLKGLGGPYYNCGMPKFYYSNTLRYYKKGDVTWGTPLAIEDIKIMNGNVKIYPNPTKGQLHLQSNELQVSEIQVFDVMGRCLLSIKPLPSQEQIIDISHLTNGIYFLKVKTADREIINKVVKY